MKIKKAILPVAGYGTRLLPATKAQPKEMIPVVDKPAIQYLVEEAVEAGIEEIIFVTGRGKHAIEDHFDHSFELEYNLVEKNKHHLLEEVRKISKLAKFTYVRQPMPLGDGHAIKCASHVVGENEPVLVMFGDSLYDYKKKFSPAKQLIDVFEKYHDPVIGLSQVEWEQVDKFGVVDGVSLDGGIIEIKKLFEKPKREEAPSNLAAVGKYIITPEIFGILENMTKGKSGEIRLIDALEIMLEKNRPIYGYEIDGKWLDTGDKFNFLKATITLALKHPEVKENFRKYLKDLDLSSSAE